MTEGSGDTVDHHERDGVRRILLWLLGLSIVAAPGTYARAPVPPGDVVVGIHVLVLGAVWLALWRRLVTVPTAGLLTVLGASIGAVATTAATAGVVADADLDVARLALVVMPSLVTVAGLAMATIPRRSIAATAVAVPSVAHVAAVATAGDAAMLTSGPMLVALRYSVLAAVLFAIVAWIAERRASDRDAARQHARLLAQRQATREQVWRDAAHELRTPLSILVMTYDAIDTQGDSMAPEDRVRLDGAARRAVRALAERLEAVGAEPSSDATVPPGSAVWADEIVTTALDGLHPMLRGRDLRRDLDRVTSSVPSDALRHVVENLVANAVKYGPVDDDIHVRLEQRSDHAVLHVRDGGRTLREDEAHRVFERGFRTEEAQRTAAGDGLGLALVRGLVHDWGGEVGCEVDGDGTTFWCTLPTRPGAAAANGHAPAGRAAH